VTEPEITDNETTLRRLQIEEEGRERKREMWMWFIGLMVSVVAITIVVIVMFEWFDDRNLQENLTKRERIAACQGIEAETVRVVCVNGWNG
jgi:hypothetical protein